MKNKGWMIGGIVGFVFGILVLIYSNYSNDLNNFLLYPLFPLLLVIQSITGCGISNGGESCFFILIFTLLSLPIVYALIGVLLGKLLRRIR